MSMGDSNKKHAPAREGKARARTNFPLLPLFHPSGSPVYGMMQPTFMAGFPPHSRLNYTSIFSGNHHTILPVDVNLISLHTTTLLGFAGVSVFRSPHSASDCGGSLIWAVFYEEQHALRCPFLVKHFVLYSHLLSEDLVSVHNSTWGSLPLCIPPQIHTLTFLFHVTWTQRTFSGAIETVMINLRCPLDWVNTCPDSSRLNIFLNLSVRVCLKRSTCESVDWIKKIHLHHRGWISSNSLKVWMKQKNKGKLNCSLLVLGHTYSIHILLSLDIRVPGTWAFTLWDLG